ncbi:MAG: 1-acyl-sn-glycerol-3-phosphate acyltransferase [Nevskia sp.]|nr:1-acyl-sn-glycerol-3-phosphate acyltransferase [Nevskia sp.]
MLRWLPAPLLIALTFLLLCLALVVSFLVLMLAALPKLLLPARGRAWLGRNWFNQVVGSGSWWGLNRLGYLLLHGPRRDIVIEGEDQLDQDRSWLLICNHQGWSDIPVLLDVFGRRIPFTRFFLKKELIWVPVIGLACVVLDMPFMKRHSKEAIAANPALKGQDLEATRKACEKYRQIPVTMVNFLEGTRFTEAKRVSRHSPYANLLRPKAAGLSFALNAMGEQFAGIVDVTLCYVPSRRGVLWGFLAGEQAGMKVRARVLPVPAELLHGDYQDYEAFRQRFQGWVNELWERKDAELTRLKAEFDPATVPRASGATAR